MDFSITPKQKKLLAFARVKGKISINTVRIFYSDQRACRNAIERLVMVGFLKKVGNGEFIYNQKKEKTILDYIK